MRTKSITNRQPMLCTRMRNSLQRVILKGSEIVRSDSETAHLRHTWNNTSHLVDTADARADVNWRPTNYFNAPHHIRADLIETPFHHEKQIAETNTSDHKHEREHDRFSPHKQLIVSSSLAVTSWLWPVRLRSQGRSRSPLLAFRQVRM